MGIISSLRSTLTYPIAATLVLVTVVPVTVAGLLFARYNYEHLTTEEKRALTRQTAGLASEVSLFLGAHSTQLESTARALEAGGEPEAAAFERLLRDMAAEPDRTFLYLQVVDVRGEGAYVRRQVLDPETTRSMEAEVAAAHQTAMTGVPVEGLVANGRSNQAAQAIVSWPLKSRTGSVWGALTGVFGLEPLEARFNEFTSAGMLVTLFDDGGTAVVSSDRRLRQRDLSGSSLVRDFLGRPMRLTRTYDHPVSAVAGEVLGSVAPVQALDLGLLMERPTADAFAPVRVMQQRTIIVSAVAAVVALGIGFLLSRQLIVPLQNLASISSQIADGNFAVRAGIKGEDEIARLAGNFNHMAGSIEALVRRLRQALRQNQELFLETIQTLAAAIDAKDQYTRGHSERVSSYSMAIARHLGLGQDEVFRVRIAAILHDVGKLGIRDGILNKPGGLTEEEFAIMRGHPDIGAQIMAPIRMLRDIIPGIRNHHETWDGTGYPDRLTGEEIPMVARIIGVADTFDAMTTTRPYQQAMRLDFVLDKMRSMAGSRFDPAVVDALIAAVSSGDVTPPAQPQRVPEQPAAEVS